MTRGFPDWRPPSENVTVSLASVTTSGVVDIIASPGAGFRLSLYALWVSNRSGAAGEPTFEETTSANVTVRRILRTNLAVSANSPQYQYFGLPFGENNKLRQVAVVGNTIDVFALYTTEAV